MIKIDLFKRLSEPEQRIYYRAWDVAEHEGGMAIDVAMRHAKKELDLINSKNINEIMNHLQELRDCNSRGTDHKNKMRGYDYSFEAFVASGYTFSIRDDDEDEEFIREINKFNNND